MPSTVEPKAQGLRHSNGYEKYRDQVCTFNEDLQGTGAITLAAVISALRVCGTPVVLSA